MITIEILNGPTLATDDDGWQHYAYTIRLDFEGRTMESPWSQGTALLDAPTARDVLQAMLSDAWSVEDADGFEDWAANFGFDPDSRKAFATWEATLYQTSRLQELLGEEYDAVRELETEDGAAKLTAI